MAIFEVESWVVAEGKDKEHKEELRRWIKWVNEHRELFQGMEERSLLFQEDRGANKPTRHLIMWEYDSLADYEAYKTRRKDYDGPVQGIQGERPLLQGRVPTLQHDGGVLERRRARVLDRVTRRPASHVGPMSR